ncbi:alpha-E domain-containing protein, partial [bacterium]|nr:alpha-E domain-containing protein [bacterium]
LVMDIPGGAEPGWDVLLKILQLQPLFEARPRQANEQNILRFLLCDKENPSSILFSIACIRENVRTTRDQLPKEVWEYTNELHIFANEYAEKSVRRRNRYAFLERIIADSQQMNGLLLTTLNRDHAYRFIKIGRLLERADMTSRVIDVGASVIRSSDKKYRGYEPILWTSLLNALSATSSYRDYIGPLVEADSVVNFVFKETANPRSCIFCLKKISQELYHLDHASPVLTLLEEAISTATEFQFKHGKPETLHQFVDKLQLQLATINDMIDSVWFSHY